MDVLQRVQEVAKSCMGEWSSKPSEHCQRVVFQAAFVEGRRKEGMSKEWFEYIFQCLASMQCWDADEVLQPWTHHVVYDILAENLERENVASLKSSALKLGVALECDAKGNEAQLAITYHDSPPVHLSVGNHAVVEVSIQKQVTERNYVRKDAPFSKVFVEARKVFTFREHFDWKYTFVLRYREPCYETQELMQQDATDKNLIFRDTPLCLFYVTCEGITSTSDHAYFADSFLCKVTDLLYPSWSGAPIRLIKT